MSDNYEHRGWAEGDAAWAVPDLRPPLPPLAGGGLPPSSPRGPSAAMLVLVGAVVAFLIAMGLGTIQSRLTPPASSPGSTATGPSRADQQATGDSTTASSSDPVVDKIDDAVVNITTALGYENGAAAGTGMVLTPSGQVLTNNHVIEGSTRITATVSTTGKAYTATVVGTYPTEDIAVLQLQGASNLKTVSVSSARVKIGDPVVALGNAGGEGGPPAVVTGAVIALGQSITATDESGADARRLTDLIQVSAPIESGDSGGPLANSSGEVIGLDTAASVAGGRLRATTTSGYAIPITKAMTIVKQIQSGVETDLVHIGLPGFLGVQLTPTSYGGGALVAGVEPGTPADSAGIAAGDRIVSVNGAPVTSASALSSTLQVRNPGDKVTVGWTTSSGASRSAKVTLVPGPAD